MYNFIFYFIYRTQLNQKTGGPFVGRILGSMFVFIFSLIHILFLFTIYKYIRFNFFGFETFLPVGNSLGGRLAFLIPIMIIISIIVYRFFNEKKIEKLDNRYSSTPKFYSLRSVIIFLALFFIPVFVSAYLSNHS